MFTLSLLYLALTIIRPQDYMPALTGVPLLPVVLVLAFLLWTVSRTRTFDAPQFKILPVFLIVGMLSLIANGWTGGALELLQSFAPTVIAFFVLAAGCNSQRRVTITMAVFVLCSMVLALHSVGQASTGTGWTGVALGEDGRIRYVGIFNDPNDLGLLFAATLPMAFFLSRRGGILGRPFWFAGAALLLYGVYLTKSRGDMLAVLVMGGIYVWHRRGMVTAGVLSAIGLAGMKLISMRMQQLDADESSALGRVDAWYEGMHMFLSHPVLGVGVGNFTDYNQLTAHNSFVLVLAETGLIGYTLWLPFVGYGFWMMVTVLRHKPESVNGGASGSAGDWQAERTMALTLLLSLCGLFASAFFLSRSYTIILYLIIAVVTGYYVGARQRWPGLQTFRLGDDLVRWVVLSLGSIVLLYIITTVLLISS
jgi:O-antigen ligase